jgi:hypothetical protein
VPSKASPIALAERNAAWHVAFAKERWRERHGGKQVPSVETNKMIKAAIEEAAKVFKVPVDTIKASNIGNLLKNRQVVVRK